MVEATDPPESAATTPAAPSSPTGETSADPSGIVLKVAAAIGTGIGVLGFVTFFGGAILWVRADEAGLPGTEAISVVPNGVLVATGATFLVPAVLIALLAVTLIFAVHLGFRVPREIRVRDDRDNAKQLGQEADAMSREASAKVQTAEAARALANSLQQNLLNAKADPTAAADPGSLEQQLKAQEEHAKQLEADALFAKSAAAGKKAEADNILAASEAALERSRVQFDIELAVGIVALAVIPPLVNGAILNVSFFWRGLILVGVAILVAAISVVAYVATNRFIWFGVAAFITVGIFLGFATYFSTTGNPKAEPVAALRTGHDPVVGTFIADTSSNLYVGTFQETGKPARMVVIPRSQVSELTIGPLLDPDVANERAIEMAIEECEEKIEVPKPAPAAPTSPASQGGGGKQASKAAEGPAQEGETPQEGTEVKDACSEDQVKALRRRTGDG